MKQIRRGVFETNSSSVHSISIMTQDMFERWRGTSDVYMRDADGGVQLATIDELRELYEDAAKRCKWCDTLEEYVSDIGWSTYDEFGDGFSYFEEWATLPSGEEVVAVGYYGYDG